MNTPEGWQLVPVEPTNGMLKAAEGEWLKHGKHEAQFPLAQGFDSGLPRCWQLELSKATHVYRAMLSAAPQPPEQPCMCGDRAASACPGEWEPGCDLGANEKHVRVGTEPLHKAERPAPSASKSEVKRVATLMGWTPPIEQPAPQGGLTDALIERAIERHVGGSELTDDEHDSMRTFARAIERELLAMRKRSEDEVARIMEAVDDYEICLSLYEAAPTAKAESRCEVSRATLERLIRGDSA